MKFEIKNRWTGEVQFTVQIKANEDTAYSIKLGLAVKAAVSIRANLSGANLSGAYLSGANLSDANLSRANLSDADLSDANLSGTCFSSQCRWEWIKKNAVAVRAIEGRTLVLAIRTRKSIHIGSFDYSEPGLYRAVVFSTDPATACHPGLYVAGKVCEGEPVDVAFWLDEAVLCDKLRVPRFRRLANREEFDGLGLDALDGEAIVVKGWTEPEGAAGAVGPRDAT